MEIDFQDLPPEAGKRLDELYVWVGVHADGAETLLSADLTLPLSDGTTVQRHMPLLSSTRRVVESPQMRALARRIQLEAMRQSDRMIAIEIHTYRVVREGTTTC